VVDRARFDVASRLLTESDASSLEVAYATAYSDPSHFARAFRRIAGVSPREYRAQAMRRSAQ
jgi:AraC-like DNA-binding protein